MSLRTGLVRAAYFSRISHPRLPPSLLVRASHDAYNSTRLEHFLLPLRYPDEPNAVRRHYLPLVAEIQRIQNEPSSPPLPPLLTREQLITIIDLLATSGRPPDVECIRAMFSHLPTYFGVAVTPELHSVVIAAMLRQGYVPIALQWLTQIHEVSPHVEATLDNFHTFLKACPNHVSDLFLRDVVVKKMRRGGVRPTHETFAILIRCIIQNATQAKTSLSPDTFTTLIADMKKLRLSADPDILALMVDYYREHGFLVRAENIRDNYVAQFPDIMTPEEQRRDGWLKQLAAAAQEFGVDHALALFHELAAEGCPAASDTFRAILSASKSVDDLLKVEEALAVKADAPEYAVLVNNNVRVKGVREALAVYEEAKKSGIVPVAGLVSRMIRSLASAEKKQPKVHNADLDIALSLYSDVDEAFPVPPPESPDTTANNDFVHSNGPDVEIYTSLLRGIALSSNVESAQSIAGTLVSDMMARGITPTAAIKTSNLILTMRSANTLEEAFKRYRKGRSELTESGYHAVLHAFSRLSRTLGHPDLLEHYFQMVDDMKRAGFRVTDRVYTDILQQFSELAGWRRQEWRRKTESYNNPAHPQHVMPLHMLDDLLDAVRYIHNLISLDDKIAPERSVWNQLMDTYQRLGSFAEAYRVWETMFLSGKYGPVAVSIILDACGYAQEFEVAKQVIRKLMTAGYVLNLHNWNSYVECLCRGNQFSEALKVVCLDMGHVTQPVKPDPTTVTIMLKAADTRLQANTILKEIRRNNPELWAAVSETHSKIWT